MPPEPCTRDARGESRIVASSTKLPATTVNLIPVMGAILAILGDPTDPELAGRLEEMLARSPHRGAPERHLEDGLALAAMSLGRDASLAAVGDRVVAFHGWIGNWAELASEHGLRWAADDSDAAKMATAYEALGDALFAKLRGEWSVLVWDRRRRTLLAARDVIGSRPLFYQPHGGRLYLATEIRQALAGSGHTSDLNEGLVARWLLKNFTNEAETAYRGVGRIRPSFVTIFSQGETAADPLERQYWTPPEWDGSLTGHGSLEEIAERLRGILETAVRRAIPDRPFAVALSGGLDSTMIMGLITRLADGGHAAARAAAPYSQVYTGMDCDESEHIRAVWRHNRTEGVMMDVAGEDFLARMKQSADDVDVLPLGNNCLIPMLAARTARDGRSVVLTGHGGDHWFWSAASFLPQELLSLRIPTFLGDAADLAVQLRRPFADVVLRKVLWPFVQSLTGIRRPRRRRPWINKRAWRESRPQAPGISPWEAKGVAFAQNGLRQSLEIEQSGYVVEPLEQATAGADAEVRHPFMDLDVIETVFRLPPRMLTGGKQWRGLQRQIAMGLIPESVRQRTDKTVFSSVFLHPVEKSLAEVEPHRWRLVERSVLDPDAIELLRGCSGSKISTGGPISSIVSYELFSVRSWNFG